MRRRIPLSETPELLQPRFFHICLLLATLPSIAAADEKPRVDFARDVLPLFKSRCFECHDNRKRTAGLRLDVRASALRGGDSGAAAIVAGDRDKSELLRRITSDDKDERMPPKGDRLSAAQIQLLRDWIDQGASWPDALAGDDTGRSHWAFRPPQRPALPAVKDAKWCRNDIDRFILARLEKEEIGAVAGSRSHDADPPAHARSHRPAADARRGRRVRPRQVGRRL